MTEAFSHVETWVFDLDNTLYPASCRLFDQIDRRMGRFIADLRGCDRDEARRIQKTYFRTYGTTMRGLMTNDEIDPEVFLSYVHDIDYSPIEPNPRLDRALDALPGRKLIFTNASVDHADRVLDRLGLARHFEAAFDIRAADWRPKPDPRAYRAMVAAHDIAPAAAALVEDIAANLAPAHDLGMTTILVRNDRVDARDAADGAHVHYKTDDLTAWIEAVVSEWTEPGRSC